MPPPNPGLINGSTPLQWGGAARVPQRAGGDVFEPGGEGDISGLRVVAPPPVSRTHQIFAADYLFADGKSLLQLGTAGLLQQKWGTVLSAEEDDGVDVQVEESDWGKVLAVGLVAQRGDVTLRCRLTRAIEVPVPGKSFQFNNKTYVVIRAGRASSTRTVHELTVTGAQWDRLGAAAFHHQGIIGGWSG